MKIELMCEHCGRTFLREKKEHTRSVKKGRKTYCSAGCAGRATANRLASEGKWHGWKTQYKNSHCQTDEYSVFRYFITAIHCGKKTGSPEKKQCLVTLQDLKEQWEKQDGICPYTGWKLKTPTSTRQKIPKTPDRASLDRVDSSKPYTKDNIEFVSLMAQYAKNGWEPSEVIEFCKAVATRHKNGVGGS